LRLLLQSVFSESISKLESLLYIFRGTPKAMPNIRIQDTELAYDDAAVMTFDEGLIGLPHLRRMVLIKQTEIDPFLWFASLDDPSIVFLVVDPYICYPSYAPRVPSEVQTRLGLDQGEAPLALSIVLIDPAWTQSTVNLRAPILIAPHTRRGAQVVQPDHSYRVDEPLPVGAAA
jgi:flagellar assembly factor FliW